MERSKGWHMANDQISLEEYLAQLNSRIEDFTIDGSKLNQMGLKPVEPLTYSSTASGTNHPSYGAVPNANIGSITTGTSGSIFVSPSGTGGPVWTTTTTNPYTAMGTGPNLQPGGKVVIQGEDADLVIGKKSMRDWMEKVEERLNILTPNPEMEKEWDDLRKLGERYRKLEKKCKEKSHMWNKLKAMPKPEIK
jgi:hypothetical protein